MPQSLHCDFPFSAGEILFADGSNRLQENESIRNVIFAEIDVSAGSALEILSSGETALAVLSSWPDALHFVETPPTGSVTLTTIFLKTGKAVDGGGFSYRVYRAVRSRHVATLKADGKVSQHYGSCKGG